MMALGEKLRDQRKSQDISKVFWIHPLGTINFMTVHPAIAVEKLKFGLK